MNNTNTVLKRFEFKETTYTEGEIILIEKIQMTDHIEYRVTKKSGSTWFRRVEELLNFLANEYFIYS